MKRFYTLAFGLMMGAAALFAQETEKTTALQFVTITGSEENIVETGSIEDGATIVTQQLGGLDNQIEAGIAVKNVSDAAVRAQLKFEILELDNGDFSCCFGGICKPYHTKGTYYVPALVDGEWVKDLPVLKPNVVDSQTDLQSHWVFNGYGKCVVKFTVGVGTVDEEMSDDDDKFYNVTEGSSITVTFLNADPTGINNIENTKGDNTYYDLTGRKIAKPVKGIYVKNGKKVVVNK